MDTFNTIDRHLPEIRASVVAHVAKRLDEGATIVGAKDGKVLASRKVNDLIQTEVIGTYGVPDLSESKAYDMPIRIRIKHDLK